MFVVLVSPKIGFVFCHIKKAYDRKKYGTMIIIFWVLFGLVNNLMAQDTNNSAPQSPAMPLSTQSSTHPPKRAIDINAKPVMCEITEGIELYLGRKVFIPKLKPESIPIECEVLVLQDFSISNQSEITCNYEFLKQLTAVRPVIVALNRKYFVYKDWPAILASPDKISKDTNALIQFAKNYNVLGFRIQQQSPQFFGEVLDLTVATNIIPYIQLLKAAKLIVGYSVDIYPSVIKNPCITDCLKLNEVVDYFEYNSYYVNDCDPSLYNGLTPIKLRSHGTGYMVSMEEIVKFVKASQCDLTKSYYTVELSPYDKDSSRSYISYSELCSKYPIKDMCIPDTKQYFAKGQFIKLQQAGVNVKYTNLDDILGTCGCGTFIGFRNVYAGYHAQSVIQCKNFDLQPSKE